MSQFSLPSIPVPSRVVEIQSRLGDGATARLGNEADALVFGQQLDAATEAAASASTAGLSPSAVLYDPKNPPTAGASAAPGSVVSDSVSPGSAAQASIPSIRPSFS